MNRSELIGKVAREAGISRSEAGSVLDSILDSVRTTLMKGGRVNLPGLGTFSTTSGKARACRNPQTGEAIKIPNRKSPGFTPAAELRRALTANGPSKKRADAFLDFLEKMSQYY